MIYNAKSIFGQIKQRFSIKTYIFICITLWIYSLMQISAAEEVSKNLYIYKYGIIHEWILFYKNMDCGSVNLFQCIFEKGYLGVEVYPQYILGCAGIIYVIGIVFFNHQKY